MVDTPFTCATMSKRRDCLLPNHLDLPSIKELSGKRVILASNSPRRKDILATIVRPIVLGALGLSVYLKSMIATGHFSRSSTFDICRKPLLQLIQ